MPVTYAAPYVGQATSAARAVLARCVTTLAGRERGSAGSVHVPGTTPADVAYGLLLDVALRGEFLVE